MLGTLRRPRCSTVRRRGNVGGMSPSLRHWIEELEEMAEESADFLNEENELLRSVIGTKPAEPEDQFEWSVARLIERLGDALEQIAAGAEDPQKLAAAALDAAEITKALTR